jgi:hypothetical protein
MGSRFAVKKAEAAAVDDGFEGANDVGAPDALESGTFPVEEEAVTLVVDGWSGGVEPGRLSWVFPSLAAALDAAGALRNAATWKIVRGA